jgi:hypothetical protein
VLQNINSALEHILGKSSAFKFNLTHVLLMAVVVMLMIIYNAIDKNNKLQEKQLALLKNKRD